MRAIDRKLGTALAVSVALHLLALGVAVASSRFAWPSAPIPIEIEPPKPKASRPPPPAPPPSQAPPPRPGAGAGQKRAAPKPPALEPSDLSALAPDEGQLVVLLRCDKLSRSPHAPAVDELLGRLPDTRTLLGGTGLKPLADFTALLVATPDPRDVTATFLAARYKDDPRIRALGSRSLGPDDPRQFRFLRPGLAVLARPEAAERLDRALDPQPGRDGGADDPHARWLAQLEKLGEPAGKGGPALLVSIADIPSRVRLGEGLPTPLSAALALTADGSPAVRLRVVFANPTDAARMEQAWPDILRRYRSATALVGLSPALDGLRLTRRESELDLEGRLDEGQIRLALSLALAFLPTHPNPAPSLPAPEPQPEREPDPAPPSDPPPTHEPADPMDAAPPPR